MAVNQLQNFSENIKKNLERLSYWPDIQYIFQLLDKKERLCWLSGGAVRDLILGFQPLDIDLTTDALEEEILSLFPDAILVGKEFGVYKIPLKGQQGTIIYDLTVFRKEDQYQDGRRPQEVSRATPEEDALRRDFTMNALYWDLKNETLIDYVDGVEDIRKQIIKCVGNPAQRFQEDHLRILRMVRFSSQLGFKVEPQSYQQGLALADSLTKISGERILSEVLKLKKLSARLLFYKEPLVLKIFECIGLAFHESVLKLEKLSAFQSDLDSELDFESEQLILTELLFLLDFNKNNVDTLQKRLKISGALKAWLLKCCEVQDWINQQKAQQAFDYNFCMLLDKSSDYRKIMKFFVEIKELDSRLAQHIIVLFDKHKIALLQAKDLLTLIPHQHISKVLSTVRIMQFQEKLSDFKSAVNYVKNLDVR